MQHAWGGYEKYAWGMDELRPQSNSGVDWLGLGATIVDSLDTLWIMGMQREFEKARGWVATVNWDRVRLPGSYISVCCCHLRYSCC